MKYRFSDIKYGDRLIICSGEITVSKGMMTVVTGESGGGKSSLFSSIYLQRKGWESRVNRFDHLSFSHQVPDFIDTLTIREHMNMILQIEKKNDMYEQYIDLLDLRDLLDLLPEQLSGGEQKRAAFLLCILKEAEIYILDEPSASLNREYAEVMLQIMHDIMSRDRSFLVFTHDAVLYEHADHHYHIQDKQLHCIRNSVERDIVFKDRKERDFRCLNQYFSKMKKHRRLSEKLVSIALCIMIAVISLGGTVAQLIYRVQQNALEQVINNELTVYLPEEEGYEYYCGTLHAPLSEEDLKKISQIEHVDRIEWRYDFQAPAYYDDLDLGSEEYKQWYDVFVQRREQQDSTINVDFHVSIYQGDELIGKEEFGPHDNENDDCINCGTYLKDHKDLSEIETDFSQDGVFISKSVAIRLCDSAHIEEEEMKNCILEVPVFVPLSNRYGLRGSTTDMMLWDTGVTIEYIKVPVAGILKENSFGVTGESFTGAIFLEREKFEELLNKHKNSNEEKRTLYVVYERIDGKLQEKIYEEIPEGKDFLIVDNYYPWKPVAYSVIVSGVEYLSVVKDQLEKEGYCVNCDLSNAEFLNGGIYAMKDVLLYGAIILSVIVLISSCAIEVFRKKKEAKIDRWFRNYGLHKKEIYEIRKRHHTADMVGKLLISVGVLVVFKIIFGNVFTIAGFALLIIMSVIVFKIIPDVFDRKRLC